MGLQLGIRIGGSVVAGEPPIITASVNPTLDDPVRDDQTPADVFNAGSYESTAGTIASAVPTYLVNGSSEASSYDLQEGDTLRVTVLVTDSESNTRTFSTQTRTVTQAIASGAILDMGGSPILDMAGQQILDMSAAA